MSRTYLFYAPLTAVCLYIGAAAHSSELARIPVSMVIAETCEIRSASVDVAPSVACAHGAPYETTLNAARAASFNASARSGVLSSAISVPGPAHWTVTF